MSKTAAANKAKDKKAARKAAAAQSLQHQQLIKTLKQDQDLLAQFPSFKQLTRNGIDLEMQYLTAESLPKDLSAWVFDLTKRNIKSFYENCPGWGWNDTKKRRELEDSDARFIIATAAGGATKEERQDDGSNAAGEVNATASAPDLNLVPGQPLGFVHLRFEMEEDEPVLYVYEIHVEAAAQGRGLGRFLMQLAELIARRAGLSRVMLTVFKKNAAANALYSKLGYVMDEGSPGVVGPTGSGGDENGYEILTKRFPPPKLTTG